MSSSAQKPKIEEGLDPIITLKIVGDSRTLTAARSLLIKASKYFESLLSGDSLEPKSTTISLPEDIIPWNILELIDEYIKSNMLQLTPATIEKLFVAADYLKMDAALKILMDYLHAEMGKVDPESVKREDVLMYLRLMDIVKRYYYKSCPKYQFPTKALNHYNQLGELQVGGSKVLELHVNAWGIVPINFEKIMYDLAMLNLNVFRIEMFLDSDFLRISEEDVVRTIKMWINFDYINRKKHFPRLLRCVRYDANMKMDFLIDEVSNFCTSLESKDYLLSIFCLRNGFEYSIPNRGPNKNVPRWHRSWDVKK